MAFPHDPRAIGELPGSPWTNAKAAENWKAGVSVSEILKRGPPEGWSKVEYRLVSRRGGRASVAWVPVGVEPRAAIAKALGVAEDAIAVLNRTHERYPNLPVSMFGVQAPPPQLHVQMVSP